eukprot:TRINITY_DN366_c2_g2_i1.p1 TRINITY_DN366_c2_g2~~TRINITY_DN366_c2_g2_i1.p1  ORF type:complete len:362 (-),score=65.78 TRINITY_DN366_c2_g2_i1:105-1190(-)
MWYDSEDVSPCILDLAPKTVPTRSQSDPIPMSHSSSALSNNCSATTTNSPVSAMPSCRPSVVAQKASIAFELPANFYWAMPGKIIGMACPQKRRHIENLQNRHNVAMVVNLREVATPQQFFAGTSVRNVHVPIKSFGVPSMKQVEQFIDDLEGVFLEHREDPDEAAALPHRAAAAKSPSPPVDANVVSSTASSRCNNNNNNNNTQQASTLPRRNVVAVNCRGGKGRTGTMICCYMVYKQGVTAQESIQRVRELSPASIETRGQEEFIEEYYRLRCCAKGTEYKRSLPYEYDASRNNGRICPTTGTVIANSGTTSSSSASSLQSATSRGNEVQRVKRPSYPARDMLLANPELLAKFGRFNSE